MAEDVVIRAEGLGKKYVIGHAAERESYSTLRDVIARNARTLQRSTIDLLRGRPMVAGDELEEFWALRDVNFEVRRGDVLGIIGRNGAGKSTLLKILSRITEPTEGRVTVNGRVASLLEVGTGFHPELTGRENVYLNGAILGMSRAEIRLKFDEIVTFAEVERFLDTPVKRYSSGMYVRLAFAVAAHLEPEILIIDEVLAVGDAEFQKKCLGKIGEVSQKDGRTVIFVSHNMGAVLSLCPRALWMSAGKVRSIGDTASVCTAYLGAGGSSSGAYADFADAPRAGNVGTRMRILSLEWLTEFPLRHGEEAKALIRFQIDAPVHDVAVGIGFSSLDGKRLLTYETDFSDQRRPSFEQPGIYSVVADIPSLAVGPDMYDLDVGCRSGDFYALDYVPGAFQLEVVPGSNTPPTIIRRGSGVRLPSEWTWSVAQTNDWQISRS
jgi:lipopolysaccharide transport system ATP-binding protein